METEAEEGIGFVSPLTLHPGRVESMPPLSCLVATFLSEARGASLDNANELWKRLSQGASKGRAARLAGNE